MTEGTSGYSIFYSLKKDVSTLEEFIKLYLEKNGDQDWHYDLILKDFKENSTTQSAEDLFELDFSKELKLNDLFFNSD